jgi:hypothetical protein
VVLKTLKVSGTNIFVANGGIAGQRAQHFMIHLIPRKEGDKILEIEEKLIDAQIITKVKELVQPKLHALLGVKIEKQTTLPQEKIELPEEEIVVGKRDHPEELLDVPEEVEEVEEEKPKKKSSSKVKKVVTKEPKTVSKKNPPKKEEVALDDIADLFK